MKAETFSEKMKAPWENGCMAAGVTGQELGGHVRARRQLGKELQYECRCSDGMRKPRGSSTKSCQI